MIEANGGSLLPGLIDTHCHPFEYGWLKRSVDLRGVSNVTGIRMRLAAGVQRSAPGEWIFGMGWDQEVFPGRQIPSRGDIDDLSPRNPVVLSRVCGHMGLLNSAALDELKLGPGAGAEYGRDQAGAFTGIVKESGLARALAMFPRDPERLSADLKGVEVEASRLGLTGLHCIVSPEGYREELTALAGMSSEGTLALGFRVYVPPEALGFVRSGGLAERLNAGKARLSGVKLFTDGSLGARTAALREPYSDDPGNSGALRMTDEELEGAVAGADSAGLQVIVHAIGDRAVEQAVGALSKFTGGGNPLRHRIEHASLVPRDLRSRMARQGIRAAVQPCFVTSDGWAVERLGEERARDLYPFRSMLEEGIVLSGGSDSPVESLSPVLGVWAAATRGGSNPQENLTLEQAMSLYTANAAANGSDEVLLGEGGAASFTLFDSDITGMHPALFRKVGVLATVVDGVAVHSFGAS